MNKANFIALRNLTKRFGNVLAVDGIDLEIKEGEFFALLGPSGCGKTTLLRMIAGFETPTSGEIYLDDLSMSAVPPNRRPVNMVFQNYAIFPHLNVGENIAYGLRRLRLSRAELDRRVQEALALIQLPEFAERRSDELSGGQRQRVALARALVLQPKALLLDEPLGALDKKLRGQMQIELRALQKRVGITFVFVTHDQEEALSMSDRIAVMSEGSVLQIDTPMRLYERPTSRAVADFIGTINIFDGQVRSIDKDSIVVDAGPVGMVRAKGDTAVAINAEVLVAIRPEKLRVLSTPPSVRENTVSGYIQASAYLGDRSHFHVRINGREAPISVATQNLGPPDPRSHDQRIWLSWLPEAVIFLSEEPKSSC
jgi:spermidine/putrescine ABC transporter ATP-binding subunit